MKTIKLFLLIFFFPGYAIAAELPGDSIYHANSNWVDQNSTPITISDFTGKVQVVAFIYTYCEHSCPIILARLKSLEATLLAEQKKHIQFLLISLDPVRDTPDVLVRYMRDHTLVNGVWNILNGDPDDVLELSALIGVRYKPMDSEGNDIAHSNMITVLDKHGRIHYQMKGLDEGLDHIISAIDQVLMAN